MKKQAERIELTFSPQGEVTMDVIDMQGGKCTQVTQDFENAIGSIDDKKKKPEYYRQPGPVKAKVGVTR